MTKNALEVRDFAVSVAKEAGRLIKETRSEALNNISYKTPRDFVTSADIAAENLIIEHIKKQYPDDLILAEESASETPEKDVCSSNCWIIDPIDGTMNFAFAQHHTCVSIAYAEQGKVKAGVVYGPFYDELFAAALGHGASLNNTPLIAKEVLDLKKALICIGRPAGDDFISEFTEQMEQLMRNCLDLRRDGAAALDICWIACNRHNAFFETLNPWDIAAAGLILREAGGIVGHYQSRVYKDNPDAYPWPSYSKDLNANFFMASSPGIFDELQRLLSQ